MCLANFISRILIRLDPNLRSKFNESENVLSLIEKIFTPIIMDGISKSPLYFTLLNTFRESFWTVFYLQTLFLCRNIKKEEEFLLT